MLNKHQPNTNSGCFAAFFYFTLTRPTHIPTTRLQKYLLAVFLQLSYPQFVSTLSWNTFVILWFTPDKTENSPLGQLCSLCKSSTEISGIPHILHVVWARHPASYWEVFPEKQLSAAFTQVLDFAGCCNGFKEQTTIQIHLKIYLSFTQAGMRKTIADLVAGMNLHSYHTLGFQAFRGNHPCPLCLP